MTGKKAQGEKALRKAVIEAALSMSRSGLSPGRSGNVSARYGEGMLITPTGMNYEDLDPTDVVFIDGEGRWPAKGRKPSSEWHFHSAIYRARRDCHAVVHTHSMHATVLACARKPIPAFHYMVAVSGSAEIPCVPYATFGTERLAANAVDGLKASNACLLANHGQIAIADSLTGALELAREVEILAEQYWKVLSLGAAHILDDAEMRLNLEKFKSYGQKAQDKREP